MKLRIYSWLDAVAHFLYCPTMLGRRCVRERWHHNIHLIPATWLAAVCNRYDHWLFVQDEDEPLHHLLAAFERGEKMQTVVPVGYRCPHMTITFSGMVMNRPTLGCGCTPSPIFRDEATTA